MNDKVVRESGMVQLICKQRSLLRREGGNYCIEGARMAASSVVTCMFACDQA